MKEVQQKAKSKTSNRVTNRAGRSGQPISLYPLKPDEVMNSILQVPPESREKPPVRHKQIRKRS